MRRAVRDRRADVVSTWYSLYVLPFGDSRALSEAELTAIFEPAIVRNKDHLLRGDMEAYARDVLKLGAELAERRVPLQRITVASALSGHYAGATAGATVGVGGAVNVLLGGMHSSITLQPISIEGNNGLNVAAGVVTMNLHYVFPPHAHG